MSRSNKPRTGNYRGTGGHGYKSNKGLKYYKVRGNRQMRRSVHSRLKDILFGDAFDENGFHKHKTELFDRWYYD